MNCMKCGREIFLGQVFCKDCLADMEAYPVKPGTPVQLPTQKPTPAPRRTSHPRKQRKPEEQIVRLRRMVRGLTLALIAVVLASGIAISILLIHASLPVDTTLPGQNYNTEDSLSSTN